MRQSQANRDFRTGRFSFTSAPMSLTRNIVGTGVSGMIYRVFNSGRVAFTCGGTPIRPKNSADVEITGAGLEVEAASKDLLIEGIYSIASEGTDVSDSDSVRSGRIRSTGGQRKIITMSASTHATYRVFNTQRSKTDILAGGVQISPSSSADIRVASGATLNVSPKTAATAFEVIYDLIQVGQ